MKLLAILLFPLLALSQAVAQVLPVPNGGTGKTTLTQHGPLVGNSTGPVTAIDPGTAGQCLISGGPAVDPVFAACPGGTGPGGGIVSINGDTTPAQRIEGAGSVTVSAPVNGVTTITGATGASGPPTGPAGGDLCSSSNYPNPTVCGLRVGANGGALPTTGSGYLNWSGSAWNFAGVALNNIIGATVGGIANNGNNEMLWRWTITTNSKVGMHFLEMSAGPSTCPLGCTLVGVETAVGSTASPFSVTSRGTLNGLKIDAATGNILALGTAKFNGPVQLTGLNGIACLGTDSTGNIQAGTCSGGPGGTDATSIHGSSIPALSNGYLRYNSGSGFSWDTPPGTGNVSSTGTTPVNYQIPVWRSGTTIAALPAGNANQVLTSNGANADPSWQTPANGPGGAGPLTLVYTTPITNVEVNYTSTGGAALQPATTMVTPSQNTFYRFEVNLKQTNTGSTPAACSAWPTVGIRLSYSDADMTNATPNGNQGGIQLQNANGTGPALYVNMNASSGVLGQGNIFTGFPVTFYARANQPITITVWQQAAATCTVYPIVMVRPFLYQINMP